MHLLTPLLHRLLTLGASPRRARLVGAALLGLLASVMVAHMALDEFVLHACAFGLAVSLIVARLPALVARRVPDPRARRTLGAMTVLGFCEAFSSRGPFPQQSGDEATDWMGPAGRRQAASSSATLPGWSTAGRARP